MELSHISDKGAIMVDISDKQPTQRKAIAHASVIMEKTTLEYLKNNKAPKGDVLNTAKIAGIMAAKNTSQLIPMCHNIPLDKIDINYEEKDYGVDIISSASATWKTGVEMEALTAASICALTIYDMLKAIDKRIEIDGKSGHFER